MMNVNGKVLLSTRWKRVVFRDTKRNWEEYLKWKIDFNMVKLRWWNYNSIHIKSNVPMSITTLTPKHHHKKLQIHSSRISPRLISPLGFFHLHRGYLIYDLLPYVHLLALPELDSIQLVHHFVLLFIFLSSIHPLYYRFSWHVYSS